MTATKRLVSFFMAVLMTFSLLAVSASAATPRNGFNSGASTPFLTEKDYYQAVGG